jgi:tRNA(His) guanylyltransferase
MTLDALGDRMKAYEAPYTELCAFKGQPFIARLDGRAFSKLTGGLKRPYDERFSGFMTDIMAGLVDEFHASIGYTQSDEITLAWYLPTNSVSDYVFGGRYHKYLSVLPSTAVDIAYEVLEKYLDRKELRGRITMDCRVFPVPTLIEAYNCFLWRQQDATKNAVNLVGQKEIGHKRIQGLSGALVQELLWQEKGINFNDYPAFFKRGTFARRVKEQRILNAEQLAKIPEQYRPSGPVLRSFIDREDIWLSKQIDQTGVLFSGAEIVKAPTHIDRLERGEENLSTVYRMIEKVTGRFVGKS